MPTIYPKPLPCYVENDPKRAAECRGYRDGTIVVPAESEAEFRRAVRALGYPLLSRAAPDRGDTVA